MPSRVAPGIGDEQVTFAPDCLDARGCRRAVAELTAQPGYAAVDRTVEPVVLDTAGRTEDILTAQDAAGIPGEQFRYRYCRIAGIDNKGSLFLTLGHETSGIWRIYSEKAVGP